MHSLVLAACVCGDHVYNMHVYNIYIYRYSLSSFCNFFLILRMLALTPMMFALILMMLSLILLEPCSDSQGCRLFRFHQPLFVSPQAYFPAMSAWLVLILPSRSGRQDAEYKIGGRAISKYKKNSTQYKKHPRTGLQDSQGRMRGCCVSEHLLAGVQGGAPLSARRIFRWKFQFA